MISVIVPIYNAESYLRECLDSIANQTYKDLEVILVNDGSTDSSQIICEEYCKKYSFFKLINKENGGQMSSWVLAVHQANGDFIGFVDSDDYIEPTMFEKMMAKQEKDKSDLVMCSRDLTFTNGEKHISHFPNDLKDYYPESEKEEIISRFLPTLSGNWSQARWDKLFKKDFFL